MDHWEVRWFSHLSDSLFIMTLPWIQLSFPSIIQCILKTLPHLCMIGFGIKHSSMFAISEDMMKMRNPVILRRNWLCSMRLRWTPRLMMTSVVSSISTCIFWDYVLYSRVEKTYVVTTESVRCIRIVVSGPRFVHYVKSGPLEKVRHNGGYVVNGVRCNATRLYYILQFTFCSPRYVNVNGWKLHILRKLPRIKGTFWIADGS